MPAQDAHAAGLPTVVESEDPRDYAQDYDEEYAPEYAPEYAEGHEPSAYGDAHRSEQHSRASGYEPEPLHEADAYPEPSAFPEPIAEEDEAYAAQPEYHPGYDMDYGYPTDAIPSFPPPPPANGPYASATPNSRGSPLEDLGEGNRAYFEGVGSTKALQAAAARTGSNFPRIDHLDMNRTPGMFATDESSGRSLSPSALRPLGHTSPQAIPSPRLGDGNYQPMSPTVSEPHAPRITAGPAAAKAPSPPTSAVPTFSPHAATQAPQSFAPQSAPQSYAPQSGPQSYAPQAAPQSYAPQAAPAYSQAPPPITAPNPARYAASPPATSPLPTAAPVFSTASLYTPHEPKPSYQEAAPQYEAPASAAEPVTTHTTTAPAAPAATHTGAAPAVHVGAYLPYVADSAPPA